MAVAVRPCNTLRIIEFNSGNSCGNADGPPRLIHRRRKENTPACARGVEVGFTD
jgi:hypothetical protein